MINDNAGIAVATETEQDVQDVTQEECYEDTECDELIAQMLLMKCNEKSDTQQNIDELRSVHSFQEQQLAYECDVQKEEIDIHGMEKWDEFDNLEGKLLSIPQHRYKAITRNNILMKRCRNGYKLVAFPSPSKIYKLEIVSNKDIKSYNADIEPIRIRKQNYHNKEEYVITKSKIDKLSRFLINQLKIPSNSVQKINSIINISETAVILHGDHAPFDPRVKNISQEYVLKIFQYDGKIHQKNIVSAAVWERNILYTLARAKIRCPQFICRRQHILVMSFIGEQQIAAPKIKDLISRKNRRFNFTAEKCVSIFKEITEIMKSMYEENVIHGNLLESILWHKDHCYVVDFAFSLNRYHECALSSLYRDCTTIINFFKQKGIRIDIKPKSLFKYITGCHYNYIRLNNETA